MTLEPGARLGPYEIGALLGQGGMGDVYRATDARVARTVAIKVLPPAAAAQPDRRQRFEREARAVARLNHPNICTLYDVGRQDGIEFLVMEYLDGETLGARLARGPLPLGDALTHAAALAQALARAHREGITHRDIKPSNVMVTEAGVKLLDFGLAKLRERDSGAEPSPIDDLTTSVTLSPEGTLVGTIAYMSPEQLAGRPVDWRTDIYALGLLVYEMITGQRAFVKGSQAGLIAAILTEEPAPMAALQPKTPAPVERIVQIALAKDPNKRWQDAGDMARELAWAASSSHTTAMKRMPAWRARELRAWPLPAVAAVFILAALGAAGVNWIRGPRSAAGSTAPIRHPASGPREAAAAAIGSKGAVRNFAILPCRAASDQVAQAFCDGLTDTLSATMTPLAVARGLQVTSTLEVRRRGVSDAAQARRDFGATLVLEGSILRAADSVRVNYVLVDTSTLKQIDAFSSTAPSSNAFGLQDRVAAWAASALALKLSAEERQTLVAAAPGTAGALALFLEGRGYLLNYQEPGNIDRAIGLFDRAIALDPRYAPAYSGLGAAYWQKYEATQEPARVQQARAACAQAVALDAELSGSHICLGTIALGTGAAEEAVQHFQQVVAREPTNDEATLGLARAQARAGEAAAAEATYKRAIELRPEYWATHVWLGTFYREHGRYAEAVTHYEHALAYTPDNPRALFILGGLYGSIGRYDDAIFACRKSAELAPSVEAYGNWGMTLARLRRYPEAAEKFEQAKRIGPDVYRLSGNLARVYFLSNRRGNATTEYRRAIALADRALTINPQDVDARISLAAYHAKLGDKAMAVDDLRRLPAELSDPHLLVFRAVVQCDLGDRAAALESIERASRLGLERRELRDWQELDVLKSDARFAKLVTP